MLLHVCCAPCAVPAFEDLEGFFDVTCHYYNPNIFPYGEFDRRLNELQKLCEMFKQKLNVVEYHHEPFLAATRGLEGEREGGTRCNICITDRLRATAIAAKNGHYDCFCTTLTTGSRKNSILINEIGESIAQSIGIKYIPSDFKKRNGNLRSKIFCDKHGIYRQNYCGCTPRD